jgi:hypothetical protein
MKRQWTVTNYVYTSMSRSIDEGLEEMFKPLYMQRHEPVDSRIVGWGGGGCLVRPPLAAERSEQQSGYFSKIF